MKIILIGPPGSGKGTLSKRLVTEYGFKHISTGDLLRQEMSKNTDLGREISLIINNGKYANDDLVFDLMKPHLNNNFILDGYPRDVKQIELLDEESIDINYVLYLKLSAEKCASRLLNRNDDRSDDSRDVIMQRMKIYEDITLPVIEYYKEKKGLVHEIDADRSVDEIFNSIKEILKG